MAIRLEYDPCLTEDAFDTGVTDSVNSISSMPTIKHLHTRVITRVVQRVVSRVREA